MDLISLKERSNNFQTRTSWNLYASHRKEVMELISAHQKTPNDTLCLLGAGNCNDVDLPSLLSSFSGVELFDLDKEAIEFALENQQVQGKPGIALHTGIDFSGIIPQLERWQIQAPSLKEKRTCLDLMSRNNWTLPYRERYDLVVSCCMISQMLHAISRTQLSNRDQMHLADWVRLYHLSHLIQLLTPSGTAILLSDVASTERVKESTNSSQLPNSEVLRTLVKEEKFFNGLNPFQMLREAQTHFSNQVYSSLSSPWIWQFSPQKYFLTYAIVLEKLAGRKGTLQSSLFTLP
ncbi:MAG: hypothetical protein AAGA10_14700 [Bacteroidota bacterium]